jgi:hypothetical protein
MTRAFRRGLISLVVLLVGLAACGDNNAAAPPMTTEALRAALDEAMQDAYRAQFTYARAQSDFGPTAPFSTLGSAEQANATMLAGLYASRNLTVPAPTWSSENVPRYPSLQQACLAGEEGELATQMMFERLLQLNVPNDVRSVFDALRTTTRMQHRAAFGSCAGGSAGPVSATVAASMTEALQGEYRTFYTDARILADLGKVAPFAASRDVEWQHVGAAANLFVRRSMTVPTSGSTLGNVPRFTTGLEACAAGVDAGFENAMMYDRLRLQALPTDVQRVFENLRAASRQRVQGMQPCAGGGTPGVNAEVLAAMTQARRDAMLQYYTYYFIIGDVPTGYPFTVIRDAEATNLSAIDNLFTKRSLPLPTFGLMIPAYHSVTAACNAGKVLETNSVAMYGQLLALTLPDDARRLFERIRAGARDDHLPVLTACGTT